MLFSRYPFSPRLLQNIEAAGLKRPTDIQYRALAPILRGSDLLAIAHTGTGKTLAYVLPLLHLLSERMEGKRTPVNGIPTPAVLVLVPTHELAQQVADVFSTMARGMGLPVVSITGGVSVQEQAARIPNNVAIVVATPGRAHDLARNALLTFEGVRHMVFDEADRMLSLGFLPDIERMLQFMPRRRQTLFLSATISPEIKRMAYRLVSNPIRIEIAPENPVAKTIHHALLEVSMEDKRFFLERIIRAHPDRKILVFVRTKLRARRVHAAMERVGIPVLLLHGDLTHPERAQALTQFAAGECQVMVATDVGARGLDIPNVAIVVNYDMPSTPETYVHRIGRTGRFKERGEAVSFCAEDENRLREAIERFLGELLPIYELSEGERLDIVDESQAARADWQTLMRREQEFQDSRAKKKRKRKGKG